jgi:hypothetical protein
MLSRKSAGRRQVRLRLETFEDRIVPSSSIIESFEPGALANYTAALRNDQGYSLTHEILPIAAHDNSNGLVMQDDYGWVVRNDSGSQVHPGDTVSVWVDPADVADGRAYLGFDAKNTAPVHSRLSESGAISVVMAPNTNQLMIESQTGSNGIGNFTMVAAVTQTYVADQWYRLEATWGTDGTVTANLYGSDGTTLLNSVSHAVTAPFPNGAGIAFRAFGHDKYFDTVVLDTGSTDTPAQRVAIDPGLDPGWTAGDPPAPVGNNISGFPTPVPWAYTPKPGTGIVIQLQTFNQLQQAAIVNGVVGLAAGNVSLNNGTVQVGWGEPLETPLLAQYIFRQRPGESTQLIGASSVKHFFSTVSADFQHLNPGETDPYGASLNTSQNQYTYGSEIDPVTGTLHSKVGRGHLSNDGMLVADNRTFTDRIQYLLQVNVSDLDPAQNPAGTHWYLMGNLFVDGQQDVTQSSRWEEITPAFNGTTFTFTYPHGSDGQLNFRTIPGLTQPAGPTVLQSAPTGSVLGSVNHLRVNFDRPIDPSTFTLDQVDSFTVTAGSNTTDLSSALIGVAPVAGTSNRTFDISFYTRTNLGHYTMVIGPNILDTAGTPMDQNGNGIPGEVPDDEFTANFNLDGLKIVSITPNGTNHLPSEQISSLTVTFNEPISPATFTPDEINDFYGPDGIYPITGITPVAGSNNTQMRLSFAPLVTTGLYTIDIGPYITDAAGNAMDQDGDGIPGEYPNDVFHGTFGIQGLKVTGVSLNNSMPGQAVRLRVTFNEPPNPLSFDLSQITGFMGPDGMHVPTAVVPVSGSNLQMDVQFAPLTAAGAYTMVIGPTIYDFYGNAMDQDGNLIAGEPDDAYTANFSLTFPRLSSARPPSSAPYDHVRLTFDRAMDPASFDPSELTITGPGGISVPVSDVSVAGSGNTTFDAIVPPFTVPGSYTLRIGAGINDSLGNPLAPLTTTFRFVVSYSFAAATYQDLELLGQPDAQALTFTSGSQFADNDYGTIDLGTGNAFNFYGTSYSRLFVSSNGLITFGSGNSVSSNTNLIQGGTTPTQPAIAPLWSDWVKTDDGSGPMILYQFTDDGQLIIEWNQIQHVGGSGTEQPITFQAMLSLNTGPLPGDIVVNYVDLATGDSHADGRTSTIGLEDNQLSNSRTLVSFNSANALVGSGKAIRLTP